MPLSHPSISLIKVQSLGFFSCFSFKDLPSEFGPRQGFCITVHIWVHDHQSAGFHLVPSQHLSEQLPSWPSDELSPQPQETPPLPAPPTRSAPPARTATETGRGSTCLLPQRKHHRAGSVNHCFKMKHVETNAGL